MPFGPSNTPASFQDYIHKIVAVKLNIFVIFYLDNILVYTKDWSQPYMDVVCWVLKQLWKYGFYANLEKWYFYQDEVCFLGFIVFVQGIRIEEKRIKPVITWAEPQLVRNIQVFIGFANFYQQFIQGFSKIAAFFTLMLKTTFIVNARTLLKIANNSNFLIPEAKLAFLQLRQAFT